MIAAGDRLPEGKLKTLVDDGVIDLNTKTFFTEKRIVLFAVPGAFTPGCSQNHLPAMSPRQSKLEDVALTRSHVSRLMMHG